MIDITKLEQGFRELLDRRRYDIWFSGTFKKITTDDQAVKEFKGFFKHLNTPRYIYFKDRIYAWIFVEQKPWHDRAHIHALIQGIDPANAKYIQKAWDNLLGEAKVEPYDYTLARPAAKYLALKYVDKYNLGWLKSFGFCKINSRWRNHRKDYSYRPTMEDIK